MDGAKISYYRQIDDINCNASPSRFCALVVFEMLHDTFYSIMKIQYSKEIMYILYKFCYFIKLIDFFSFFLSFC